MRKPIPRKRGRPPGSTDEYWPDRLILLLKTIVSIQAERWTVSMRELEEACSVSRQTIVNWLRVAEQMGYIDLHNGQPRALQVLPAGRKLVKKYESLGDVGKWRQMREELRKQYANF